MILVRSSDVSRRSQRHAEGGSQKCMRPPLRRKSRESLLRWNRRSRRFSARYVHAGAATEAVIRELLARLVARDRAATEEKTQLIRAVLTNRRTSPRDRES